MVHFYSPSPWEVPKGYEKKFQIFGMGPTKAKDLARKINLTRPKGWIVISGCAGALSPKLRRGHSFLVTEVLFGNKAWKLSAPKPAEMLPRAKLTSVSAPVWDTETKKRMYELTGAEIVDCEIAFFLDALDETLIPQVLLLRTVIDESTDAIRFFDGYKILPLRLLHPIELGRFIRFVFSFLVFRSRHSQFFKRVDRLLFLDEPTQA